MLTKIRSRTRWWSAAGPVAVAGLIAAVVVVRPAGREAAAQPAAALPADLALVPADAAGFVHVRLADLWMNPAFDGLRKTWERAGEKAVASIDKQFVPAPSSLDRVTAFVVVDPQTKQPHPLGVIAFSAAFDPAQLARVYLPNAAKAQVAGKTVYTDGARGLSVAFPDDRHVLLGAPGAVEAYLARPVAKEGALAGALQLATTRPVVPAANIAALPIPPGALDQVPAEYRPLLRAEQVVVSLELGAKGQFDLRATYKDADAAGEAEKAARAAVGLGRQKLAEFKKEAEDKLFNPATPSSRPPEQLPEALALVYGLGSLGQLDDLLADPKLIVRDGQALAVTRQLPEASAGMAAYTAVAIGLMLPAVQKVRAAAAQATSQNNLKQILLATHSYCDAYNGKMPADIVDKDGKPLLSWRVALLPYIEQSALYGKFKLDEPWDGPNNKQWSKVLVKTYLAPANQQHTSPDGYALTNYKAIAGPGTAFEPGAKLRLPASFTDGLSNTVVFVDDADAVIWAKPGDIPYDPKKPLPKIVSAGMADAFQAGMGDGSVRRVNTKAVSEKTLRAAFTRAGDDILGKDW